MVFIVPVDAAKRIGEDHGGNEGRKGDRMEEGLKGW